MRFWFRKKIEMKKDEDIDAAVEELEKEESTSKEKQSQSRSLHHYRQKLFAPFAKGTSAKSVTEKEKSKSK
jgi:hypothetical protein